jgi:hypothetical protein
MPITTGVQIVVLFSDAARQPIPPTAYFYNPRRYLLKETQSNEGQTFTLHVSRGEETTRIPLSPQETQQLARMIANLPEKSMSASGFSLDGLVYEVILLCGDKVISYQWKNQDWRGDPNQPQDIWERTQAFADQVQALAQKP